MKTHDYDFYVVFLVKHIFNQAVDLIGYIDFTPTNHVSQDGDR